MLHRVLNEAVLEEHKGAVLIHCKGGMNRSPAITIAYIMKFAKMTMTESMTFAKFRRNCINSTRFEKDLLKYQKYFLLSTSISPRYMIIFFQKNLSFKKGFLFQKCFQFPQVHEK